MGGHQERGTTLDGKLRDTSEFCRHDARIGDAWGKSDLAAERKRAHNAARSNSGPNTMNWGCPCTSFDCVAKLTETMVSMAKDEDLLEFCKAKGLFFATPPRHLHKTLDGRHVRAAMVRYEQTADAAPDGAEVVRVPKTDRYVCVWPNCHHIATGPFVAPLHSATSSKTLRDKLHFMLGYSFGKDHMAIARVCRISANSCTLWREELEATLAAAHLADTDKWRGKALFIQGDEFPGRRVCNRQVKRW